MTASAAVKGIRQSDTSGMIGIISNETSPPYNRPPLSKGLWKGESLESIWSAIPADKLKIHLGRKAMVVNPEKKIITDDHGDTYSYDALLFATGGRVRRLQPDVEGITYFRTLDDYVALRAATQRSQRFAVIGGGFIGSEIAAALALAKKSVTMIFPEEGIGARVYPHYLSEHLTMYYQAMDVEIVAQDSVAHIDHRDSAYHIRTTGGLELEFDEIVAGIGIQPNTELAQAAGLAIDNGIIVNENLQTTHPDIFAAGDVANFYNPALGKRVRVEHEDNAIMMGETAGINMAGGSIVYDHFPYFYSDLFTYGYEAVGELDARYEMVEDWKEEFEEGVVYYLHEGRIRGILLWNTWGQLDAARKLVADKGPFNSGNVLGRLPV
jgi:3-phenylpropionate/trans-cinnamate dioxygenase ferredoxin reductase component